MILLASLILTSSFLLPAPGCEGRAFGSNQLAVNLCASIVLPREIAYNYNINKCVIIYYDNFIITLYVYAYHFSIASVVHFDRRFIAINFDADNATKSLLNINMQVINNTIVIHTLKCSVNLFWSSPSGKLCNLNCVVRLSNFIARGG